jgi:hypothetical protein
VDDLAAGQPSGREDDARGPERETDGESIVELLEARALVARGQFEEEGHDTRLE